MRKVENRINSYLLDDARASRAPQQVGPFTMFDSSQRMRALCGCEVIWRCVFANWEIRWHPTTIHGLSCRGGA